MFYCLHAFTMARRVDYFAPSAGGGTKYCSEPVCMSNCPSLCLYMFARSHIPKITHVTIKNKNCLKSSYREQKSLKIAILYRKIKIVLNVRPNKAIVDYTSPALCTPVMPFPPVGDTAYRQDAGGGRSHGYRQNAQKMVKIARVVPEISSQTDRQTNILITILRNRSGG